MPSTNPQGVIYRADVREDSPSAKWPLAVTDEIGTNATSAPTRRIGVFDSGVGGLTVIRALRAALPSWDIIYLGDTARIPYGTKSRRTVEHYSLRCQKFLLQREADIVLVACNTASAIAIPALERASDIPVIGAVEPGARAALAATRNRHIGVIATTTTVDADAYRRAIYAHCPEAHIAQQACPLFVPLAEEGWVDDHIAEAVAERYLARLFERDRDIDTLVLGCTHYPLLFNVLCKTARRLANHDVVIVDSARALANATHAFLDRREQPSHGSQNRPDQTQGQLHFFATDTSLLDQLAPRFLGEPAQAFTLVDL